MMNGTDGNNNNNNEDDDYPDPIYQCRTCKRKTHDPHRLTQYLCEHYDCDIDLVTVQ